MLIQTATIQYSREHAPGHKINALCPRTCVPMPCRLPFTKFYGPNPVFFEYIYVCDANSRNIAAIWAFFCNAFVLVLVDVLATRLIFFLLYIIALFNLPKLLVCLRIVKLQTQTFANAKKKLIFVRTIRRRSIIRAPWRYFLLACCATLNE